MLSNKYKEFLKWNIYQIYPKSFYDSNDDGIGDINGIILKLDYLKDLGINAIWLCPCYKTENRDNGYDISDYYDINPQLGTFDDIKNLINELHKREMKLIMDLVPNHTSDKHKWFMESKKSKNNPYSDYYYWFDEPINDWKSAFVTSAWQYCPDRNQYYLHSYDVSQPDLNWDNESVRNEICKVIDFWVSLGVDGFRIDVIDQISKDFANNKNCFGPNLHKYINEMFGRDNIKNIFTVGECWADTPEEINKHCKAERGELTTLFQFEHLECGRGKWKFYKDSADFKKFRNILIKWQNMAQDNDIIHSLFTDNHDNAPLISRMEENEQLHYEVSTCIATMVYLLKGIPFIYQGQEFGTVSAEYDSINDFDDVESLNAYKMFLDRGESENEALKKLNFGSRDNARRPVCWDDSEYNGFSGVKPWISCHSKGKEINLKNDKSSEKSVFKFYKELLKIRNESQCLIYGDFRAVSKENDDFFAFERYTKNSKYIIVCNFCNVKEISIENENAELILSNYDYNEKTYKPYEIRVFNII